MVDHAHRLGPEQVAQGAERLALVLDDLVGHVAEPGVVDRQLGQRLGVARLVQRPGDGGHGPVDLGLGTRRRRPPWPPGPARRRSRPSTFRPIRWRRSLVPLHWPSSTPSGTAGRRRPGNRPCGQFTHDGYFHRESTLGGIRGDKSRAIEQDRPPRRRRATPAGRAVRRGRYTDWV